MPLLNDTNEQWTCVMPDGTRGEPRQTESAGVIRPGVSGYFTTSRPEVAKELEERYPGMLVTHHEKAMGGRASRKLWTVPQMPWKEQHAKEKEASSNLENPL